MEFYSFKELDPKRIATAAEIVSDYSQTDHSHLAPVSFEEISSNDMAFAGFAQNVFVGYIRAKEQKQHHESQYTYREIGSLLVAEAFRGMNVARSLVGLMTDEVFSAGDIPCALTNQGSQRAFLELGYEMALPGELPDGIQSNFGNTELVYPAYKIVDMHK